MFLDDHACHSPTFHHVHGHVRLKRFGFLLVFGDEEDAEEAHSASVERDKHWDGVNVTKMPDKTHYKQKHIHSYVKQMWLNFLLLLFPSVIKKKKTVINY